MQTLPGGLTGLFQVDAEVQELAHFSQERHLGSVLLRLFCPELQFLRGFQEGASGGLSLRDLVPEIAGWQTHEFCRWRCLPGRCKIEEFAFPTTSSGSYP